MSNKIFSDCSEIFFCFIIRKKLNKSCSLKKIFLFLKKKVVSLKKLLFLFSQKDTYLAFSFLSPSVLLSCYHHLKAKLGMYFGPSISEHFRMVWRKSFCEKSTFSCKFSFMNLQSENILIERQWKIKECC